MLQGSLQGSLFLTQPRGKCCSTMKMAIDDVSLLRYVPPIVVFAFSMAPRRVKVFSVAQMMHTLIVITPVQPRWDKA